jgi:hypothetical protein
METTMSRGEDTSAAEQVVRIAAVVGTVVWMALLTFVPVANNDFWLQARIGQLIIESGEIPHTLLFPFTWAKDYAFNAHEWLPSILFHWFDVVLGHERLPLVAGTLGLLQFGLCVLMAYRASGRLPTSLVLAAIAMLLANYRYHLRPELFAIVLLLVLLIILDAYRTHGRWRVLVWTIPIAAVWANSHGSFMLGPVVALLFAAGQAVDTLRRLATGGRPTMRHAAKQALPYIAVAAGMLMASLVTPLGVGLFHFVFNLSGSEVTQTFINEWSPTLSARFIRTPQFVIFAIAAMGCAALGIVQRRHVVASDALLVLAFAALALQRTRFVALFGFAALLFCARLLSKSSRQERHLTTWAAAAGVSAIGIAIALKFGNVWGAFPFAAPSNNFTELMRQRLSQPSMQGNVLTTYELGAELVYRAWPRLRPSLDSRIDSYGDQYFLMHEHLMIEEPLLKAFIADFDVRYMLLLPRDYQRIIKLRAVKSDWLVELADHKMILLRRADVEPSKLESVSGR